MWHWTEYKLSVLQVRISEENELNATTQQFITAKISCWAFRQGSKTHSSLRQSNLQLQNEAALMSRRIRAIKHRKCTAGLSDAHPGLQDWILLNYTRIENMHKAGYARKLWIFSYVQKSSKFLVSFFLLRHYQTPECFYVKNCCFWARATVLSCYRNWQCSHCGQHLHCSAIADKIKTIVSDKANYRGTHS